MNTAIPSSGTSQALIPADQILRVAQTDAEQAYGDLSRFRVSLMLTNDGWHVDYELIDTRANGGGPHYVIDATNGTIASKRYDQ